MRLFYREAEESANIGEVHVYFCKQVDTEGTAVSSPHLQADIPIQGARNDMAPRLKRLDDQPFCK